MKTKTPRTSVSLISLAFASYLATQVHAQVPSAVEPRLEVTQVSDAKVGDEGGLRVRVRLSRKSDGSVELAANEICIEKKDKTRTCDWFTPDFFPYTKVRDVRQYTVRLDGALANVFGFEPASKFTIDLKTSTALTQEAILVFKGVTRVAAVNIRFGNLAQAPLSQSAK